MKICEDGGRMTRKRKGGGRHGWKDGVPDKMESLTIFGDVN